MSRPTQRAALLLIAFLACCFDYAWAGAYALVVRWAIGDPEQDPIYLFLRRHFHWGNP